MKLRTSPCNSPDSSLAVMHCDQIVLYPVLHIYWGYALVSTWSRQLLFFFFNLLLIFFSLMITYFQCPAKSSYLYFSSSRSDLTQSIPNPNFNTVC